MQFDWIMEDGEWIPANHEDIDTSSVAEEVATRFLRDFFDGETPEVIDPYEALELEPPRE